MTLDLPVHGGDLSAAARRWGEPMAGWLDLSTGITPWPYPLPALPALAWTRLPLPADEQDLRQAAAEHYGCPPESILATPGSSAAIQALPRLLPGPTVAVLSPTYGEHARAWRAAGRTVLDVASLDDARAAPIAVAVNPNNPDGRRLDPDALRREAERRAALGQWLVVDEAFGDVAPELSVAAQAGPGLVVLRSFGKFHGLAGLRLGFVLAPPPLLAALAEGMGPWPLSGPALLIGATALRDKDWTRTARDRLHHAAQSLDETLTAAGLTVTGGTDLFRLATHPEAPRLWDGLGRQGILVRAFADHPSWLRIGLPADRHGLDRLAAALAMIG